LSGSYDDKLSEYPYKLYNDELSEYPYGLSEEPQSPPENPSMRDGPFLLQRDVLNTSRRAGVSSPVQSPARDGAEEGKLTPGVVLISSVPGNGTSPIGGERKPRAQTPSGIVIPGFTHDGILFQEQGSLPASSSRL
jgi:hypothetical protein